MIMSLYSHVKNHFPDSDLLSHVLQRTVHKLQLDFSRFADCGAGVGHTALRYLGIMKNNLEENAFELSSIMCYEPLPENCLELTNRINQNNAAKHVILRNVAVSDFNGFSNFFVPRRMTGSSDSWSQGTSAVGFLSNGIANDSINVKVIRLEEEPYEFDFIKFDLQGGEKSALAGLGEKISKSKILYIEQQLLSGPEAPEFMPLDYLWSKGFICFYDEVQFGVNPQVAAVPLKLLRSGGIEITNIYPANGRGLPMIYKAAIKSDHNCQLKQDGSFPDEYIRDLKRAGIPWMATDIVAINKEYFNQIVSAL